MAILEIQGVGRVEVGEEFLSLPPEQQHATVQEIAASAKPTKEPLSVVDALASRIPKAISDIPSEIKNAASESWHGIKEGLNPIDPRNVTDGALANMGRVGGGLMAAAGAIPNIAVAPFRSLLGHPLASAMPNDIAQEGLSFVRRPVSEEENYAKAKGGVDLAAAALMPGRGGLGAVSTPPVPPSPMTGPMGVILTEGQTTRALPAIQTEQAALRGTAGPAAQGRAQQFADQQRQQVTDARGAVSTGLDEFGQQIARSPQEAAEIAQKSIQTTAAQRKAGVTQAYDEAKAMPGEIHAAAFEGIGPKIKAELSAGDNPIIIDDKLTPHASRAIQDVENRIAQLKIQNRADPFGQPNQENITGVNLRGIDQMRRRLSAFRNDAYGSGNAADGRAARAVVDAFDAQVDNAINGGLFKGDQRAVQAWNDARAAHSDYKSTFSAGKGDPVGRVVERILGKGNNPAAIPNDVADFIYGSSGVNPNSLNVAVSKRVRSILGDQSPEWSGIKQGLFSRLVETPEGVHDMGAGKVAQRLNQFLSGSGKELAETMFSPIERSLLKQYADLHRALEVPQAGANWSNTAAFLAPMLKSATGRLSGLVGGLLSHIPLAGPVAAALVDNVGGMASNAANFRQIVKQMPLVIEAARKFQAAVAAHSRAQTPPSNVALSLATSNLSRAFKQIGVDLGGGLQSMGASRAEENQPYVQGPGHQ